MKPRGLDWDLPEFDRLLGRAKDLIIERYADMEEAPAFSGLTPAEVRARFAEELPAGPMDMDALLARVKADILDTATLNIGPNMYAYVMTCGTQVSVLAEMLAAAINQNGAKWHLGPALSEIEQRVIQWGGEFIGFSDQAGGFTGQRRLGGEPDLSDSHAESGAGRGHCGKGDVRASARDPVHVH